jgi:transposase InsO family protein
LEFVHVAQDEHSRLAASRVLPDERHPTAIAFLPVGVDYYRSLGIQIRAILTDNGSCYRSRAFRQTCSQLGSQHPFTRPYRPRTKGKAERFIQTLLREWAREWANPPAYDNSAPEPPACRAGFHHYNWHRPHGSLDKSPRHSRLGLDRNNLLRIHT